MVTDCKVGRDNKLKEVVDYYYEMALMEPEPEPELKAKNLTPSASERSSGADCRTESFPSPSLQCAQHLRLGKVKLGYRVAHLSGTLTSLKISTSYKF